MYKTLKIFVLLLLSAFFFACSEEPPIPKPKTYLLLETTQPLYSLVDEKDFDINKLTKWFDKDYFFIKLSPINKNTISEKNNLGDGIIEGINLV
jgi:hypothetical protein